MSIIFTEGKIFGDYGNKIIENAFKKAQEISGSSLTDDKNKLFLTGEAEQLSRAATEIVAYIDVIKDPGGVKKPVITDLRDK